MKIKNFVSDKHNAIANQFEITIGEAVFFQSYKSIIAKIERGITYLDEVYWNYSKTTSKYRNMFLGENTNDTKRKIDNGEYILTDLNAKPLSVSKAKKDFKFLK